ncbi:tRNA (adenosine(37)-N6)-threonylcarbamoyltransferase complex transferase subunit TsaD [bacterium]|nr:MAG: tRNA (adenosine(37)-N6)-threonylcarbamoyltransferase complex transferase subunit TsaD [bacterium]
MRILAIETSCDETALALLEASGGLRNPKFKVLKSIVSSQIAVHRPWGGVVPNLAKREHIKNLPVVFKELTEDKKIKPGLLAVTVGPGLEPALWTGVNFAKELKKNIFPRMPLIGANHLEGHLYSVLLDNKLALSKIFPAIALIVSGGHTILLRVESLTRWKKLGETRDDAVGEAFDKVAKMLQLPYPGGPEIQKLAVRGNFDAINFPRPMLRDNSPTGEYDFSFSGLKTSVLYYLRDNPKANKADVAASFQKAAVDVLTAKTIRAAQEYKSKSVILSGGVAANAFLRETLGNAVKEIKRNFLVPPMSFNTDNAVMIAAAAYVQYLRKKKRTIRAQANLNL